MLTEERLREMSARGLWVCVPAMIVATGAMFLYMSAVGHFRESLVSFAVGRFGEAAGHVFLYVLFLPAIPIFLVPTLIAAAYAGRFKTACPLCHVDISSRSKRVLLTRCCPACGDRILEGGRAHSAAVYGRYQAIQSRSFLKNWLWTWPAIGGLCVAWQWADRSAFRECPNLLWRVPLIGTAVAGWAWLRTSDRRYVPQLLASAVLFVLGAYVFWSSS
jgi:hypothetical protein